MSVSITKVCDLCISHRREVTVQVVLSEGQVALESWRKGDSSHDIRVIQYPEAHVTSDHQPAQVLQRPWLAWGYKNRHITSEIS